MSVYLDKLRTKYDGLRTSIEGLQTRAADENRDLTEDELRSVTEQADEAKKLAAQITDLTEIEVRNRKVAEMAGQIGENTETRTSSTTAKNRDPGHYTRNSKHSFFGDFARAERNEPEAKRRIEEHTRALATTTEGPGLIPPVWMTEEYATISRQGRAIANACRRIALSNASPITLPRQTASTVTAVQSAENAATSWTNGYDSAVTTITPETVVGGQEVSRQFLDAADPSIDQLIWTDLIGAYNAALETRLGNVLIANGTALAATEALFGTMTTEGTNGPDLVVDAATAVATGIFEFPDLVAMTHQRYGEFLKLKDTTGRPVIGGEAGQSMNVVGVGDVTTRGVIHGLGVVVSQGMAGAGADPDEFAVYKASDLLLFESPILQFSYEQPKGPETIRLGVWAYVAAALKRTGAAKRVNVTAV